MAPTPITPNARVSWYITVNALVHRLSMYVNATGTPGSMVIIDNQPGAPNFTLQQAADTVWNLVRPLYQLSVNCNTAALELYSAGAYAQDSTVTPTNPAGTNGAGIVIAGEATYTFKDDTNRRVNLVLLETCIAAPAKQGYAAMSAAEKALIDSMRISTLGGDIRDLQRSRGDHTVNRFIFKTTTYNRRLRRKRGLL